MRTPSLLVALDYLELLADVRPDKFDRAVVRWHGQLELGFSSVDDDPKKRSELPRRTRGGVPRGRAGRRLSNHRQSVRIRRGVSTARLPDALLERPTRVSRVHATHSRAKAYAMSAGGYTDTLESSAGHQQAPTDLATYLLVEDVADRLRCSIRSIHELTRSIAIPHRRMPGLRRCLFRADELEAWENGSPLKVIPMPRGGRAVVPRTYRVKAPSRRCASNFSARRGPRAVDVARKRDRRVAELRLHPRELCAALKCDSRERVSERVEGAPTTALAHTRNAGSRHRRVMRLQHGSTVCMPAGLPREDEAIAPCLAIPGLNEFLGLRR
jgi:Helix-turn-helix domain